MRSDSLRRIAGWVRFVLTLATVIYLAHCFVGYLTRDRQSSSGPMVRTVTVYDTIPYYYAVAKDSVVIRYETYSVAMTGDKWPGLEQNEVSSEEAEARDSAKVELPIIQRHYADSTYEAWISGPIDPRLDSLRVFAPRTIITRSESMPTKRWHLGITAGFAFTPKGVQPYFGAGITYSFKSF